jgi:cytochrome c-type biogenesis protein
MVATPNISLVVAFLAGIISFLSPCLLPIVPGFLAYLAGASLNEAAARKREVFLNSLFFVFGFSLIFASVGVLLNSVLSFIAFDILVWLSRAGGLIIIFFGLYLIGLIKVPFLEREYKIGVRTKFKSKYLTSFLFGAAFAVGWTPCVGAVLGSILALAATQPGLAFSLLLSYSLGLGIPFLMVGLFASPAAALINRYARFLKYANILFGLILIVFGVLVFTRNLSRVANFELLNRWLLR